jgi:Protein of unknown function (DUF4435)
MTNLELEAQYFKNSLPFLGKDLALRVEGKEDVVFWQAIFQKALPNVRVEIFHFANEFPSANAMGKEAILPLRAYADNKLCVCIDSDYDFLLGKNYNDYSPFVFQTYTYSIENYYAVASRLPNVIQKTANTSKLSMKTTPIFLCEVMIYWISPLRKLLNRLRVRLFKNFMLNLLKYKITTNEKL